MKRTLTDRLLKSVKPRNDGKPREILDDQVRGLAARVMGSADKLVVTFVLVARYPGAKSSARRSIGRYPEISLAAARETAMSWRAQIAAGIDPQREAERQRLEAQRRQENSFAKICEEFIRRGLAGQRNAEQVARELRREFIARWADRPISSITRHDVVAVVDAAVDRGAPAQARNLFGDIRALFNWVIGRGIYGIEASPCDRVRLRDLAGRKVARNRILTDDELRALWLAAEEMAYPFGPLIKLLVLTGQRRSEVAEARWAEFDLEARRWIIPAARMKGREGEAAPHLVALADDALELLKGLPRFNSGDHLFSFSYGKTPVNGFSLAKRRLDAAIAKVLGGELQPFVLHDVRRSVRTHLSALPVPEGDLVRELIISHARPGLHRIYDLHSYESEKRAGLSLWEARLRAIVAPAANRNVINLADRRG
jgi:integrase